jgi:hypothetical protein
MATEDMDEQLHVLCNRGNICKCEMAQCCTRARYLTLNIGVRCQRKYHNKIDYRTEISEIPTEPASSRYTASHLHVRQGLRVLLAVAVAC